MRRKIITSLLFLALLSGAAVIVLDNSPAHATQTRQVYIDDGGGGGSNDTPESKPQSEYRGGKCEDFLGMVSWDCGVPKIDSEDDLKFALPQIALNLVTDITIIAAYLIIGYVIYAGYLYMFSGADPGKVATGKKTLVQGFTGLAIVMSANLVMNTIRIAMLGAGGMFSNCENTECIKADNLIIGVINWFIGIAGFVSVIYLIYGGVLYITSSGDSGKAKKARDAIKYSLIGLVIVGLATTITAIVSSAIRNANTSYINQTIISKEVYEKNI